MNKLLLSAAVLSSLGLFNAYTGIVQAADKAATNETQTAKQYKGCNTPNKESCCKSEKAQTENCCACCSGTKCDAKSDTHCCG